tara:strand:- start:3694 stop:4833 length:1140 start_codon:yes stop_codon:yes gene_type:complete
MNILIWAPFIQKVGTTTNVENLIYCLTKFSKKKCHIDLLNVFGEWDDYEFEDKNVNIISLSKLNFIKHNKKNGFIRSRFYTILIILYSFVPLLRFFKRKNYDFVFAHLITSLPILVCGLIKKKPKLILSIAGFPKLTFLRSIFWKFSENNIYRIICPSKETKDLFIKKNIFKPEKLYVIRDPHINVKKILKEKKIKLEEQIDRTKTIVSIGRLTKQKNYIFLLQAFKKILNIRDDLKLIIIGDGEDKRLIEKKINEFNIQKNVNLVGFQKNIYKYLNNSLCYFSASLWEGPDLAMLDAAFLNVPLICSDCKSGRKEFIKNNERGYIFRTNDMESLLITFKKFLNEDKIELRKKILESKKEVKNFTRFRYYKNLQQILYN